MSRGAESGWIAHPPASNTAASALAAGRRRGGRTQLPITARSTMSPSAPADTSRIGSADVIDRHAGRQLDDEAGTRLAVGAVLDPDPTVVQADVLVDEGEAEPGALAARSAGRH